MAISQVSAVERLTALIDAPDRYDIPHEELLPLQLAAADELFQDRVTKMRLLRNRAESGGVSAVARAEDIVPLLYAHTTFKSYPESWLAERHWSRMVRWLETVSVKPVEGVDLDGVEGIDDWLERLEQVGHLVSCSSGTTGKSAMLNASPADVEFVQREVNAAVEWATGVPAQGGYRMFSLAPVASVPRNRAIREGMRAAFGHPALAPFVYPVPPITVGSLTGMVALRKAMAEGTAKPGEIEAFERISAERQAAVDAAVGISAKALVDSRGDRLFITGMWSTLHKVAAAVRAMGFSAKDFHPANVAYIGGGLKGAVLPDDYREFVFETFNLAPPRIYQMYGMQELNSSMPRCSAGRYHVPPWVMLLLLDESGETLLEPTGEDQEGRAAFFDIALQGRWNGVISGDRIKASYGPCACGNRGPSIDDDIRRFADLPGGDKISCAGTIDAYVRGVA